MFAKLPTTVKKSYINYILHPKFGYFRNCARKTSVFQLIDSFGKALHKGAVIDYNRQLLSPYIRRGNPIFQDRDCPTLMEPAPVIATRELIRYGDVSLILAAINQHADHPATVYKICRRVLAESDISTDMRAAVSKACGSLDSAN